MKQLLSICSLIFCLYLPFVCNADTAKKTIVYQLNIKEDISPKVWRDTQHAFSEADSMKANVILIHMNTYGGLVFSADSIRSKILNSNIPVYVFIDNNAASAGALISIACDSIYMRKGGSIGAASVVDKEGKKMPDKYQSYMRATMRATAEAHGKDSIIIDGKLIERWKRNPTIAEAMVDEKVIIPGIIDSTKILTFTPYEAIKNRYCEGEVENITELLKKLNITDYEIIEYKPSFIENIIGFLVNPMISGLLIMAIIGGIYFEMQSPGIGFPLIVAILAAIAYFAPLYLEGLAENWEILLFIIGLILIALEIFVVPGFGITGIAGIITVVVSLVLSLLNNISFNFDHISYQNLMQSVLLVLTSISVSVIASIFIASKLFASKKGAFSKIALNEVQNTDSGFVGVDISTKNLIGKTGFAYTVLRPSGKVKIENKIYDAVAIVGMINKNDEVIVVKQETAQIYVEKNQK